MLIRTGGFTRTIYKRSLNPFKLAFSNWFSSVWPSMEARDWSIHLEHLLNDNSEKKLNYATLVLNHCFDSPSLKYRLDESTLDNGKIQKFIKLWNNANIRHIVDGGGNYLFDLQQLAKSRGGDEQLKAPHLLTGDMDSIRPDVLAHYRESAETDVVETPDQDHTDFTKAIHVLSQKQKELAESSVKSLVVFYTSSGRLDHVLSIFNTLYKFDSDMDKSAVPAIILVDLASSISLLLTKGKHRIPSVPSAKWCSLVPLNGPVTLTTSGFRWNLHKGTLEFGKFISTSQEFDGKSEVATVDIADKPLLFSLDFE